MIENAVFSYWEWRIEQILSDKRMDKDQKHDEMRQLAVILCRVAYYNGQRKGALEAIKAYKEAEQGHEEAD